jgi:cytochrome c-type biogenesis protein CcmH
MNIRIDPHTLKRAERRVSRLILLLPFLSTFLFIVPTYAQETTPVIPDDSVISDDAVNAIAEDMFCPVCENVPLDVCPTQACDQWRELIRQRLGEGWTEQQIKDYFVQQYGDRVLAEPPRTGLNWFIYVIPPIVVLAGAFIVFRVLRTWKAQTAVAAATYVLPTINDDYVQRLEQELKRRD